LDDVGMAHLGDGARLLQKALVMFVARVQIGAQNFYGGLTLQDGMLSPVDAACAAFANQAEDFVAPQLLTYPRVSVH
jgi:hypothetical protein